MPERNRTLQQFIDSVEAAARTRQKDYPDTAPVLGRIFEALRKSQAAPTGAEPARLPVCNHIGAACQSALRGPAADLAGSFSALEPELVWARRPNAADISDEFFDGHANALVIGDNGLEDSAEVRIGVSLVAPGVSYPRHRHPPEEVYIVLSGGEWMQGGGPYVRKDAGDLVHNPPNIWHAMRAGNEPLLAVWCLWLNG